MYNSRSSILHALVFFELLDEFRPWRRMAWGSPHTDPPGLIQGFQLPHKMLMHSASTYFPSVFLSAFLTHCLPNYLSPLSPRLSFPHHVFHPFVYSTFSLPVSFSPFCLSPSISSRRSFSLYLSPSFPPFIIPPPPSPLLFSKTHPPCLPKMLKNTR